MVQSLADEGSRRRRFPGIAFRGRDPQRRAWVIGTSLDVWQIVEAYRDFGDSIERMAAETDLEERQIRLAIAYCERFPVEIDEAIEENRATGEAFASHFPSFTIYA